MAGTNVIALIALVMLLLTGIASNQHVLTPEVNPYSNTSCLLGNYSYSLTSVLGRKGYPLLANVTVTVLRAGSNEYLVTASVVLTSTVSGARMSFTPPLIDAVVRTDSGLYMWSKGKVFIQVLLSKKLPVKSSIKLTVRGSCVKMVEVIIKPLSKAVVFTPTTTYAVPAPQRTGRAYVVEVFRNGSVKVVSVKGLSGAEVKSIIRERGLVPYKVTIKCNLMVNGKVVIPNMTVTVYAPKGLKASEVRESVEPLLKLCNASTSSHEVAVLLARSPLARRIIELINGTAVVQEEVVRAKGAVVTQGTCSSAKVMIKARIPKPTTVAKVTTSTPTVTAVTTTSATHYLPSTTSASRAFRPLSSTSSVTVSVAHGLRGYEALAVAAVAAVIAGLIAYAVLRK